MFHLELLRDQMPEGGLKVNKRVAVRGIVCYEDKFLFVHTKLGDYKLPGGGMDPGEDEKHALLREIKEETGYYDIVVHEKIGTVMEQNLDNFEEGAMFQMESIYYICELISLNREAQVLEQYEKRLEYEAKFITIPEAYEANRSCLELYSEEKNKELFHSQIGMTASDWLEREVKVLKELCSCSDWKVSSKS